MKYFILSMMLSVTTGCVTLPKLAGSGVEKSQERTLPAFDAVEVYGNLVVNLIPGNDATIKITGDDNLLSTVNATLDDETLILKIECECKPAPTQPIVVDIQGESLRSIRVADDVKLNIKGLKMQDVEVELSDRAKLRLIDINADQLGVFASDTSEIEASGETKELFIQTEDKAIFAGDELITESAEVNSTDGSDVKLHVTAKLDAELNDNSVLKLKKQPKESNTQVNDSAVILNQF